MYIVNVDHPETFTIPPIEVDDCNVRRSIDDDKCNSSKVVSCQVSNSRLGSSGTAHVHLGWRVDMDEDHGGRLRRCLPSHPERRTPGLSQWRCG